VAAETALAMLVEGAPDTELATPADRELPFRTVEDAVEHALSHRPDLVAAREQVTATQQTRTAANLAWVPNLDGRFTQMWTQNTGFNGENWNWMAVASATWTPWDGGFRIAEQQRAASQARMAQGALTKAEQDVETEVRAAWAELTRARTARAAAARELELGEENLRMAEASHAAGASAFLELEDARMARDSARLAGMMERMGEDLAVLALLRSTGKL
jgi:outer membrane protein TolC